MMLSRRNLLLAGAGLGAAGAAMAQASNGNLLLSLGLGGAKKQEEKSSTPQMEAYKTLLKPVADDATVIRFFFLFTCPYCMAFHKPMSDWAKSLPPAYRYEMVPCVSDRGTSTGGVVFYVVRRAYPHLLSKFCENAFSLIQEKRMSPERLETFIEAAVMTGISRDFLKKTASNKSDSDAYVALYSRAYVLQKLYELEEVPTLAVGGKYTITPKIVNADMEQFITLSNAVVSLHMQQEGIPER